MVGKSEFSELKLSPDALICFALATLRMMDLDILSSTSKLQREKIAQRTTFLESFKDFDIPKQITARPTGLNGMLREMLFESCSKVKSRPHKVAIVTELAFVSPWDGMRLVMKKDVDESIRRLALKETAEAFELSRAEDSIDTMLAVDAGDARAALRDWPKIGKAVLLSGIGAGVGGFFLAPHIGAAIGGAMGLSGAAATSAGLAFVGGGSLATGGLGMAGGTIIIGATSSLIMGTTGGVASSLAGVNSDAALESQKLYVMLQMLSRSSEEALVEKISSHLIKHADRIHEERVREELKDKDKRDKKLIKELTAEEKMLRRVVPE